MGVDKRYSASLVILAAFLGLFLLSGGFLKDRSASTTPSPGAPAAPSQAPLPGVPPPVKAPLQVFPIDINNATVQELALLPGIGEKTARRIVEKRNELNGFRSVDDLTSVKWVGKVKLEKIRGLVTVSQPSEGKGKPGE